MAIVSIAAASISSCYCYVEAGTERDENSFPYFRPVKSWKLIFLLSVSGVEAPSSPRLPSILCHFSPGSKSDSLCLLFSPREACYGRIPILTLRRREDKQASLFSKAIEKKTAKGEKRNAIYLRFFRYSTWPADLPIPLSPPTLAR